MKQMSYIRGYITDQIPFFWTIPALLWQFLLLYVPLLLLLFMSITQSDSQGQGLHFTLEHMRAFLDPMYLTILMRSLLLAVLSASVCTVLAYPMAYYVAFTVRRWSKQFLFFLVPLIISILLGYLFHDLMMGITNGIITGRH